MRDGYVRAGSAGGGGGSGAVTQIIAGDGIDVDPPTGVGAVTVDGLEATPADAGFVPATTSTDGAVPVDNGAGVLVNRRLTLDDIDPAFAITSFARDNFSGSAKELGDSIVDPSFTAAYNAALSALSVNDGAGADPIALAAQAAFGYNNGGGSTLPAATYIKTGINESVTWTLSATKSPSGPVDTAQLANSWQPRVYFGIATPAAFNEAFIEALPSNRLQSGFLSPSTYLIAQGVAGQYGFVALPTGFGDPSMFKDNATQLQVPATKVATAVAVTNAFGVALTYEVWQTDSQILASDLTLLAVA